MRRNRTQLVIDTVMIIASVFVIAWGLSAIIWLSGLWQILGIITTAFGIGMIKAALGNWANE